MIGAKRCSTTAIRAPDPFNRLSDTLSNTLPNSAQPSPPSLDIECSGDWIAPPKYASDQGKQPKRETADNELITK
jgi:hypothetical protein